MSQVRRVGGICVLALVALATPAHGGPSGSAQHPAAFTVDCARRGPITLVEATGAATFTTDSGRSGNEGLIVSAHGDVYAGEHVSPPAADPVFSFAKTWGHRTGITDVDICTRVNVDESPDGTYTAFESFTIAWLPAHGSAH